MTGPKFDDLVLVNGKWQSPEPSPADFPPACPICGILRADHCKNEDDSLGCTAKAAAHIIKGLNDDDEETEL